MQENDFVKEEEKSALCKLAQLEDLAAKKIKIHSRLLMDTALAKSMEELSLHHEKRWERLCTLSLGKTPKKQNGQGMSALNRQEEEE